MHSGPGRRSGNDFYWGLSEPIFENSTTKIGSHDGDGVYLFDPHGDLRVWSIYPCLVSCTDPNQGAFRVVARPRAPESVAVTNVSDRAIDLYGYGLFVGGGVYPFAENSTLPPGRTMTVFMGGLESSYYAGLSLHAGIRGYYLPDEGGKAALRNFEEVVLGCDAWGSGSC